MKISSILSILLRLVAIGAAAFAWYTWDDTKGKTTESMGHLTDPQVSGATLQNRTAKVPAVLAEKKATELKLENTENTLEKTKETLASKEEALEGANEEIVVLEGEKKDNLAAINNLHKDVEKLQVELMEEQEKVVAREAEITRITEKTEPLIARLEAEVEELGESLAAKEDEIAEAVAAAEAVLIEQLEALKAAAPVASTAVATVVTVDPTTGEKVVVEVPVSEEYVPEGEMVKVLKLNANNTLFVVDRIIPEVELAPEGEEVASDGEIKADFDTPPVAVDTTEAIEFKVGDRIHFKQNGKFIGEFSVLVIDDNLFACGVINKDVGIPESILVGDSYEMILAPEIVEEVAPVVLPTPEAAPAGEDSFDSSSSDFGDADFGDADFGDADFGDSDFGDSDFGDMDSSSDDTDFGDTDFGDTDFGDMDSSSDDTDFGDTDFSSDDSDFGDSDFGDSDDIEF